MYCKKCGKEIANGSRYCNYCGSNQATKWVIEIKKPYISATFFNKDELRKFLKKVLLSFASFIKWLWPIGWSCIAVYVFGMISAAATLYGYEYIYSAPSQIVSIKDFPKDCVSTDTVVLPLRFKASHLLGEIKYATDIEKGKTDLIELNGINYNRLIYWKVRLLPHNMQFLSGEFDDIIYTKETNIKDNFDLGSLRNEAIRMKASNLAGDVYDLFLLVGYMLLLAFYVRKTYKWIFEKYV